MFTLAHSSPLPVLLSKYIRVRVFTRVLSPCCVLDLDLEAGPPMTNRLIIGINIISVATCRNFIYFRVFSIISLPKKDNACPRCNKDRSKKRWNQVITKPKCDAYLPDRKFIWNLRKSRAFEAFEHQVVAAFISTQSSRPRFHWVLRDSVSVVRISSQDQ